MLFRSRELERQKLSDRMRQQPDGREGQQIASQLDKLSERLGSANGQTEAEEMVEAGGPVAGLSGPYPFGLVRRVGTREGLRRAVRRGWLRFTGHAVRSGGWEGGRPGESTLAAGAPG